jgi:hypothetical protein
MTLAFFVIVLSIVALVAIVFLLRRALFGSKSPADPAPRLQTIDVQAFHNLIDESEEKFLREHLRAAEFRRVSRERTLAAIEYVGAAGSNARILAQMAQGLRDAADPAVAAAAEKVMEDAIRLRLYALQTMPRLYVRLVLPGRNSVPTRVVESYDVLSRQMVTLGCLQSASRGVSG